MSDYSRPLCEIPSEYPAGYPSVGTTSLLQTPTKPSKRLINVTGEILSLRFRSDHGKLRNAKDSFGNDGKPYPKPEWKKGAHNLPITHTRKEKIKLTAVIKVNPPGEFFKIIGDGGVGYLYFEMDGNVSTGKSQAIRLEARAPLPKKISRINRSIKWYIIGNGWRADIGSTGPHEIFILWKHPQELNSLGMHNYLTYKRIRLITSSLIAGGHDYIDGIAKSTQSFLNNFNWHKIAFGPSTINLLSKDGAQFWALLDSGSGMCGEASTLMEMMLRLIGIPAQQKHVRGVTKLPVKKHVSYAGHVRNPEERKCKVHGKEQLWLIFRVIPTSLNEGEGCCEVNNKLYTLFTEWNIIGTQSGKRTPAHHILIQLEQKIKLKLGFFQAWVYPLDKGQVAACGLKSEASGAGVPDPPVPSVPK